MLLGKYYRPKDIVGLVIMSLLYLSEASSLKLAWEMVNSHEDWTCIMRAKVLGDMLLLNIISLILFGKDLKLNCKSSRITHVS